MSLLKKLVLLVSAVTLVMVNIASAQSEVIVKNHVLIIDKTGSMVGNGSGGSADIWDEVKNHADEGDLIIDDTLADKPYARKIELNKYQYSGKHHGVAKGICLVTATWANIHDEARLPFGFKVYDKDGDGKTKNDHFIDMLDIAKERGLKPRYTQMNSWYASSKNLKAVAKKGWKFICQLECNRQVSLDNGETWVRIDNELELTNEQVILVSLKGFGKVLVCKQVIKNGDIRYLATNDLRLMSWNKFTTFADERWDVETMHRCLKQTCGLERCYMRKAVAQVNHMICSFIAYAKFEIKRVEEGVSCYTQKWDIVRPAVKSYLQMTGA